MLCVQGWVCGSIRWSGHQLHLHTRRCRLTRHVQTTRQVCIRRYGHHLHTRRFCSQDTYSRKRLVASAAVSVICPRDTGKCVRACVHAWWCWWHVHACVLQHSLTCCPLHYATSHAMIHSPHARVQLQDHSALAPFPTPHWAVCWAYPPGMPAEVLVVSGSKPLCWAPVQDSGTRASSVYLSKLC